MASSVAPAERIRSATCAVVTGSFGFFSSIRFQIATAAARRSGSGLAASFITSLPHSRSVSGLLGSALSIASYCWAAAPKFCSKTYWSMRACRSARLLGATVMPCSSHLRASGVRPCDARFFESRAIASTSDGFFSSHFS